MKRWLTVALTLVLLVGMAGISGCAWMPNTPPAPPFTLDLSFPDGAPPLGETAELVCVVKADGNLKNMSLEIDLPEAFEVVSGNLSWIGNISKSVETEVMRAVIRSVKTGNWTIELIGHLDPAENAGVGLNGPGPICYVSVSEDSAEWGKYPPWYKGGGVEIPPERVGAPFSGIKVDLSIPYAPVLNEAVDLTCTVSSAINIPNTSAQIMLRRAGAPKAEGRNGRSGETSSGSRAQTGLC